MRRIASFKHHALFGLFSVALFGAACSDDEDRDILKGGGTSGSSGEDMGGESSGGSSSAGKGGGGKSGGAGSAGQPSAGSGGTGGGVAGGAGTGAAGTGTAGGGAGGEGGDGGQPFDGRAGSGAGEGGGPVDGTAGAGGQGGAAPAAPDVLDNPGFEEGSGVTIPGWTVEGTSGAAYIEADGANGSGHRLTNWTQWVQGGANPPYTARVFQTVSPIPNGTYSFSLYVNRDWVDSQYLFASGFNVADTAQELTQLTDDAKDPSGYVKITLSNIVVTSGSVTVGIYSAAPAGTWIGIDDAELVLVP